MQVPALHESLCVQASPSSQAVPSDLPEQAPPPPVDEVLATPVDEVLAPPAPPVPLVDEVLAPPTPPVDEVVASPVPPVDDVEELDAEVSVGEPHPREWASRPRKSAIMIEDRFMMSLALQRLGRGDSVSSKHEQKSSYRGHCALTSPVLQLAFRRLAVRFFSLRYRSRVRRATGGCHRRRAGSARSPSARAPPEGYLETSIADTPTVVRGQVAGRRARFRTRSSSSA